MISYNIEVFGIKFCKRIYQSYEHYHIIYNEASLYCLKIIRGDQALEITSVQVHQQTEIYK